MPPDGHQNCNALLIGILRGFTDPRIDRRKERNENSLHWVLEVVFHEDDSRVCIRNAVENLALVRKIAHNLLQQEKTLKRGIKTKRLVAAWDKAYLLKIIGLSLLIPEFIMR